MFIEHNILSISKDRQIIKHTPTWYFGSKIGIATHFLSFVACIYSFNESKINDTTKHRDMRSHNANSQKIIFRVPMVPSGHFSIAFVKKILIRSHSLYLKTYKWRSYLWLQLVRLGIYEKRDLLLICRAIMNFSTLCHI